MNTVKLKLRSIFMLTILMLNAKAAIFLVNNTPGGPGQFTQIDPAIAVAADGDTIYVSGSSSTYNNCSITKSITLLGAGTFAQKQNQFSTKIQSIAINSNLSNIIIQGFEILGLLNFQGKTNLHDVNIKYNYFNASIINLASLTNSYNFVISGNIFNGGSNDITFQNASSLSSFTIENNIIKGVIRDMVVNNAVIANNVFYNNTVAFTGLVNSAMIANNIFYNSNPINNTTNCTYLNNISYNTSATYTSMGVTNFDNTDPLFINVGQTGGYLSTYNFGVQTGSPAHNAGTDGNDLGIYGGTAKVSVTGEVYNIPVVRQMILMNSNVPQNGNVNVKVRSTKSRVN